MDKSSYEASDFSNRHCINKRARVPATAPHARARSRLLCSEMKALSTITRLTVENRSKVKTTGTAETETPSVSTQSGQIT